MAATAIAPSAHSSQAGGPGGPRPYASGEQSPEAAAPGTGKSEVITPISRSSVRLGGVRLGVAAERRAAGDGHDADQRRERDHGGCGSRAHGAHRPAEHTSGDPWRPGVPSDMVVGLWLIGDSRVVTGDARGGFRRRRRDRNGDQRGCRSRRGCRAGGRRRRHGLACGAGSRPSQLLRLERIVERSSESGLATHTQPAAHAAGDRGGPSGPARPAARPDHEEVRRLLGPAGVGARALGPAAA